MQKHLAWIWCLVAAACGGGGGISADDLADELEGAQCDRAVACEGIEDRQTCNDAVDFDDQEYKTILAAIDDGTIKYDSGAAGDCADFLGDTDCRFAGFHEDNPCEDMFTGTVPPGGACFIDLQCADNGNCNQTDPSCNTDIACCPGTCAGSFTESAAGGPCDDDLHFCAVNTFCKSPATGTGPGTCTAVLTQEGAACDAIDACANPMYCNLSFTTGTGTCKTAAASNATCSRMDLLPCADSRDYCDMTSLTCVRGVAVGGACGAGISCVDYASCIGNVCVADVKLNGACTDTGPDCAGNLECTNGTCQPGPAGMACTLP